MELALERERERPFMGIMLVFSVIVHLFIFLHIEEIYRLNKDFKKPEPPIKIEVVLQEIPKPAPIAPAPLAAEVPPPTITEDSRISRPVIPIPEPVKEKKEEIKVVKKEEINIFKKKAVVEQKKKPVKKIQEMKKRVEPIAKVPPMPVLLPSTLPIKTVPQKIVVPQNMIAAQSLVKAPADAVRTPALVKAEAASQSDELSAKAYFNSMRVMIERNKRYPQMARRRSQEGSVRVRFLIDNNGNVNSLEIVKGCSYEPLNNAALEAVRKASPFAKPPASISKDALKLELTINFKLI